LNLVSGGSIALAAVALALTRIPVTMGAKVVGNVIAWASTAARARARVIPHSALAAEFLQGTGLAPDQVGGGLHQEKRQGCRVIP
jgi:hypothetical protein